EPDADRIIESAEKLQEAGVFSIVLEMVPEDLGKKMTESVDVPIIGIGAGRYVSGQVLVLYDLLGINSSFNPRFLKKYADLNSVILNALNAYSFEVKDSSFPSEKNVF
ncbi:MAG TPA: 3-methyl-2-oxobutanoate hydroxymethyltransferase, partial [Leptospiraceae bacterium]|nr:3-methyl-2-oxobutanoate hydroxymethyltransferase [Leptospiraceae bacterium]